MCLHTTEAVPVMVHCILRHFLYLQQIVYVSYQEARELA